MLRSIAKRASYEYYYEYFVRTGNTMTLRVGAGGTREACLVRDTPEPNRKARQCRARAGSTVLSGPIISLSEHLRNLPWPSPPAAVDSPQRDSAPLYGAGSLTAAGHRQHPGPWPFFWKGFQPR